ncbi:putative fur-regulated basic protein A [Helianthus anomalus]
MKQDYIEHIMSYKKYKAEKHQYKEWTISELKEEITRIQGMLDKKIKQTPPVGSKYKKNVPEKVLILKRMKEELIVANYGSRNLVTRWTEVKVLETYKRLEERRKKDPTAPKKPVYPEAIVPVKQALPIKRSVQTSVPTAAIVYQRKKQKHMD